ncbi:hypothetical protein AXG93_4273s1280 [Marchantia polymorpha subsp. ruderalis]|uniref:Uncharacterized protein n=1 Tax=Marchantia polymorpha subsp. ruderalis TaxID=1480154 RepID=A0A176VGB9_MARPO|nr:hypothetical protein AXG93_4273s1280 [Marchantia polymorpha subsp. ruderalis]
MVGGRKESLASFGAKRGNSSHAISRRQVICTNWQAELLAKPERDAEEPIVARDPRTAIEFDQKFSPRGITATRQGLNVPSIVATIRTKMEDTASHVGNTRLK